MKKKGLWIALAAFLLLAGLFVPVPGSAARDGGTRAYTALTYKVVAWHRDTGGEIYDVTRVYWFPKNFRSLDDLWEDEQENAAASFTAMVVELGESHALVQPMAGEAELRSSDRISFGTAELEAIGAQVGCEVRIWYTGGIMETYPAKVHAVKWELLRLEEPQEFAEEWLDKSTAEVVQADAYAPHITITAIYGDCFFARPVIPSPWEIKINGAISSDWCVGDQVLCTYQNVYRDPETNRYEADLFTIQPSDWAPEPGMAYKPVIYLYPEEELRVDVALELAGRLTCTYPAYNGGWQVTAAPDGTLTDDRGQTYNYLYWEGILDARWDLTEGFCVKGEDTAAFLENALETLGLTRREANEFIVYWLPLMEGNAYNVISFQTERYTDAAALNITPAPDTVIRVFMTWQPSSSFVQLQPQVLTAPERTGFTVVEWGGTEVQ